MTVSIVTAAPPTPNGDLHLGHLSGPYSGADIYTRAARLLGRSARFVTGSDVYQSYVPVKAASVGAEPFELADRYADGIAAAFASIGFEPDSCLRPQHSDRHAELVAEFISTLYDKGKLLRREVDALYCARCERYLFEAHVSGGCPHCGVRSDGNSCEVCAWPNVCTDLVDPACAGCGGQPETRRYEQLVFPLGEYADRLRAFCGRAVLSPQLEALCDELLAGPLPDIPISHPTDWGLPVPVAGLDDQRVYVWAEMVPGYLAGLADAAGTDDWRRLWNDQAAERVQFFGFDNGYFHALLHPALLMAYDERLRLPDALLTNEFYLLDEAKFSKSRGHAITGAELLARVPADAVRFVLAHDRPETRRTNFTWQRFAELCNGELAGSWQGWLGGLFDEVDRRAAGLVPEAGELSGSQRVFLDQLGRLADDVVHSYRAAGFSPRRATRGLIELVQQARDFADGQARTRAGGNPATSLAVELAAARTLAALASPVLPEFGRQLWTALGGTGEPRWDGVRFAVPGVRLPAAPVFFAPLRLAEFSPANEVSANEVPANEVPDGAVPDGAVPAAG